MNSMRIALAMGLALVGGAELGAAPAPRLERVVIVMRHGVRPPTKSAAQLAPLSDMAWPDDASWGAAPGELTPHGAAAIRLFGADLRRVYADQGLISAQGPLADQALIWADGADERTRETARALAQGLAPDAPPPFGAGADGARDPLFDGLGGACALDPAAAQAAVLAGGALETPQVSAGLRRLQAIAAPDACHGGKGVCLAGASKISADEGGVKIGGPLGVGATLAEDLLLEYENGLPMSQVGWGRLQPSDLAAVLPVQARASALTRATPYIAVRRAGPLARFILAALSDQSDPQAGPQPRSGQHLIVLAGHDTNLSNLAGVFGLEWDLPGQPDPTAPGTALAFERWRDAAGQAFVRVRIFYEDPDQVRTLSATPAHQMALTPAACAQGACELGRFSAAVTKALPADCLE